MPDYSALSREELLAELTRARTQLDAFKASCQDDALRLAESIVEMSPAVLFRRTVDDPPRLVYISRNVSQWGYTPEQFLGEKLSYADVVHPDDMEELRSEIGRYRERGDESYTQNYRIRTADGETRHVHDRTSVVRDESGRAIFNQGLVIDVTERVRAEEGLRRSEEKFRRIIQTAAEGFVLMDDELRFVDVNDACLRMLGYERQDVIGKTPPELAAPESAAMLLRNKDRLRSMQYRIFETVLLHRDGYEVPVIVHGNTLTDSLGVFLGHVAFVTDISEQKKALKLAEEVQRSMQPSRAPDVPGLDIAGRSEPSAEVGGDYYDYIPVHGRDDATLLAVGDISGHGVDAALLMTTARAFLRMRAMQPGGPAQLARDLNHHLAADLHGSGRFLTLLLLALDASGGDLVWTRAGHDPALLYDPAADSFAELNGSGLPIGVSLEYPFKQYRHPPLAPGQVLAIGTDGIWEARNGNGEMFGKDRLRRVIRENGARDARSILDAVFGELDRFTEGIMPEDDVTLVVARRMD